MALMFQRIARNFVKHGYFPTDAETLERILSFLAPAEEGAAIFDPCAGEGTALAEIQHHLGSDVVSYGIEYDLERAGSAKSLLNVCVHGDMQDCIIHRNQFGLIFLNPPYGAMTADRAQLSEKTFQGADRLEKLFYRQTIQSLVFGGVLVLIIPTTALDKQYAGWISRNLGVVEVYRAATDQFKQVVIFGVRRRTAEAVDSAKIRATLLDHGRIPELPLLTEPRYHVPATAPGQPIVYTRMDPAQLAEELSTSNEPGLWSQFDILLRCNRRPQRRPLCDLSDWHLALALAAGQVTGHVVSNDGTRQLLIKGSTHKEKSEKTEITERDNGAVTEKRILTDRFVAIIKGIDVTPGDRFGTIITIR